MGRAGLSQDKPALLAGAVAICVVHLISYGMGIGNVVVLVSFVLCLCVLVVVLALRPNNDVVTSERWSQKDTVEEIVINPSRKPDVEGNDGNTDEKPSVSQDDPTTVVVPKNSFSAASSNGQAKWLGWREFKVAEKQPETNDQDIVSIYLEPYDQGPIPNFEPGQYLTFRLDNVPNSSKSVTRCYSISDAFEPQRYRVSIKRVPAPSSKPGVPPGLSSNYFHDIVKTGDILSVRQPSGDFFLSTTSSRPIVLIAGGVGITPTYCMLKTLARRQFSGDVHLFYGVTNSEQVAYKSDLKALVSLPNLYMHLCLSRPLDSDSLGADFDHQGRVDADYIASVMNTLDCDYFMCGPGSMMESLVEGLMSKGVPETQINYEKFGPSSVRKKSSQTVSYNVSFADSDESEIWHGNEANLLEFALEHEIDMDFGCRIGNCGACQTKLLSGQVDYPDGPPSFAELDGSACLPCVCVPKSDVVLDV